MGGPLPPGVSALVFFRNTEGISGVSREVAQDFVHTADVYWRHEQRAYAKLDHRGDWLAVISQSPRDESAPVDIVSVRRETLDLHLVALDAVLVRVFEFDLNRLSLGQHLDFDRSRESSTEHEADLQYRQLLIDGQLNRIRGAQVIRPRLTPKQIKQLIEEGRISEPSEAEPVEFIVHDIRNGRITTVSTDPSTTTNYFEAAHNQLPFDTSPAFFRSGVLSRYRADKDKYDMSDGWITCRGAWDLRNYSINDAGQVAAYICYLRELPHEEQIYWKAFNEEPYVGLSTRAIQNDFLGEGAEESTPLEKLEYLLERWEQGKAKWWGPPVDPSYRRLVVPHGNSRDEWARASGELSNLVLEGFEVEAIRKTLSERKLHYVKGERSIALLERLLQAREVLGSDEGLKALRQVNRLRNISSHRVGNSARDAAEAALKQHGSYAAHFENLCGSLAEELALIERAFGGANEQ